MRLQVLESRIAAMSEILTAQDMRIERLESFIKVLAEKLVAEKKVRSDERFVLMAESNLIQEATKWEHR